MLFMFEPFQVDIDVERTRQFYKGAQFVHENCSCDGCQNFERAVGGLSESVKTFFATIGVDMQRICECYVNCTNDDGTLLYGGFYHVCGFLKSGRSAWVKSGKNTAYWDEQKTHFVSSNFQVSFHEDIALLEDGFPTPALQIDILANIPWVLPKPNTYQ